MEQIRIRGGARGPHGPMTVSGCLRSEDCQRTLGALRALGVETEGWEEDTLRIYGKGLHGLREAADTLDCGNSGTTIRLLAGVLAGGPLLSALAGGAAAR